MVSSLIKLILGNYLCMQGEARSQRRRRHRRGEGVGETHDIRCTNLSSGGIMISATAGARLTDIKMFRSAPWYVYSPGTGVTCMFLSAASNRPSRLHFGTILLYIDRFDAPAWVRSRRRTTYNATDPLRERSEHTSCCYVYRRSHKIPHHLDRFSYTT